MTATTAVKPWGNSNGIRIPHDIMQAVGFRKDDVLDIEVNEDTIVLRKQFRHKSLRERLEEYGGNAEVAEFDWDEPKGRELL